MFSQDLSFVFSWWSVLFFLGALFFPLCSRLFGAFADRGYIFAKIFGILIVSYLAWLGGISHLFTFTRSNLNTLIILITLITLIKFINSPLRKKSPRRELIFFVFFEEFLFFLCLLFWSFVKAHQPDIIGLEKYMDFGFINSLLRSKYFPPLDMWLAASPSYSGHFINYYYFGHLVTAVLTKLSGIDPAITFNLMLSTIFAFTFTGSFSIALNLISSLSLRGSREATDEAISSTRKKIASLSGFRRIARNDSFGISIFFSLLTAFLVTLAGNLHTIYAFTKGYIPFDKPVPFWQLLGKGIDFGGYWYPNATRFIPFTIHEFPSYSFVVSDLHGHVLDIPFVLFTIALLLHYFIVNKNSNETIKQSNNFFFLPILGLSLAVMYMTNAWDGLIYFGLSALVFLYIYYRYYWPNLNSLPARRSLDEGGILKFFNSLILLIALFVIFSLPFQLTFKPFIFGIGIVVKDHSPPWMLFILWGFFYYCVAGFIISLLHRHSGQARMTEKENNLSKRFTFIFYLNPSDIFVLLMIILSTLLLIFPELFYIKDIYPLHYRANTMFKLGYQAFIMLSLSSGYIIYKIYNYHKNYKHHSRSFVKKIILTSYLLLLTFLLFLVLLYPYFSVNSYFDRLKTYKGLNGLSYLEKQNPSDYQNILWLNSHVKGQPAILEAVGDSYTDYSRISANTGLPTVLGWPVHEWLWRGSFDEPGKRVEEVKKAYTTKDLAETKNFLNKYQVKYVVIGNLERQKYPELNEEKFKKLGKIVFQSGDTKIYEISF